jgi:ribosomal protein L37AE/L43A
MPMNRVQFQKGLSLPEFMDRYGTEDQCEQALVAARWPDGFVCPACGVMQSRTSFRREGRLYWQCAGCQYQCSVRDQRHRLRGHQAAAEALVPGHAASHPG